LSKKETFIYYKNNDTIIYNSLRDYIKEKRNNTIKINDQYKIQITENPIYDEPVNFQIIEPSKILLEMGEKLFKKFDKPIYEVPIIKIEPIIPIIDISLNLKPNIINLSEHFIIDGLNIKQISYDDEQNKMCSNENKNILLEYSNNNMDNISNIQNENKVNIQPKPKRKYNKKSNNKSNKKSN